MLLPAVPLLLASVGEHLVFIEKKMNLLFPSGAVTGDLFKKRKRKNITVLQFFFSLGLKGAGADFFSILFD